MPEIREDWWKAEQLVRSARDGDLLETQRLASVGFDLNLMDELGNGALHYAVLGEHYTVVTWLLGNGANVNLHEDDLAAETPLGLAAQGEHPELVELLLQNNADPDIPGPMQQSARIRAHARRDSAGMEISALIERYKPTRPNPGSRSAREA